MIPHERPQVKLRPLTSLLERRFRANRDYQLVAHNQLEPHEQETFAGLTENSDYFGLLIPDASLRTGVKAVNHGVAKLFSSFAVATRLSQSIADSDFLSIDDEALTSSRVAALVLDGVLETEDQGEFVSGPPAGRLFSTLTTSVAESSGIPALSRQVLNRALALPVEDPAVLSWWIYGCNTIPLNTVWFRRLGDEDRFLENLRLQDSGANHRLLATDYIADQSTSWLSWHRRERALSAHDNHLAYKLYISPHPSALIESFDAVIRVFVESGVSAFKLGRGPFGLLRPDKLVAYFDGWDSLRMVASRLEQTLSGVCAQGVPFTAQLDDDGLLSWGMDPPPEARLTGWGPSESWRFWLTNQLARALISARAHNTDETQSVQFACDRLQLEGVDTELWLPTETMWSQAETLQ